MLVAVVALSILTFVVFALALVRHLGLEFG